MATTIPQPKLRAAGRRPTRLHAIFARKSPTASSECSKTVWPPGEAVGTRNKFSQRSDESDLGQAIQRWQRHPLDGLGAEKRL